MFFELKIIIRLNFMDGKFKIFLNYINEKTHSRAYSQRPDQMSNLCRLPPRVALSVRTTTTFL